MQWVSIDTRLFRYDRRQSTAGYYTTCTKQKLMKTVLISRNDYVSRSPVKSKPCRVCCFHHVIMKSPFDNLHKAITKSSSSVPTAPTKKMPFTNISGSSRNIFAGLSQNSQAQEKRLVRIPWSYVYSKGLVGSLVSLLQTCHEKWVFGTSESWIMPSVDPRSPSAYVQLGDIYVYRDGKYFQR